MNSDAQRTIIFKHQERPMALPLQTHGITAEFWIPPKERFVTYDASDEAWARPLGYGTVAVKPVDLYDVRDRTKELIGYTAYSPIQYLERGRLDVKIRVAEPPRDYSRRELMGFSVSQPYQNIEVHIYEIDIHGNRFWSWIADIRDAEKLLRAKWLKCIGEDHLESYAHALRRRAWEQQYDRR
jgi:hypothetical protein